MAPDDVVFRMNLVSLKPGDGRRDGDGRLHLGPYHERGSGARSSPTCSAQLAGDGIEFLNGVSYRHLMVWRDGPTATRLTPPHDITGKPVGTASAAGRGRRTPAQDHGSRGGDSARASGQRRPDRGGQDGSDLGVVLGAGPTSRGADAEGALRRRGLGHLGGRPGQRIGKARGPGADNGARRDRLPRYGLCGQGALRAQVAGAP